jgi:chorismate mutase
MDELLTLRTKVDEIDAALMDLLAERFKVTEQVGILKVRRDIPLIDTSREDAQTKRIRNIAKSKGVNPDLAENILRLIINQSVRNHQKIKENLNP